MPSVAKMATPLFSKRWDWAPLIAIAAFIGVAIMQVAAAAGFRVLAPISVACAWMTTMNDNPLIALAGYFALLSLFAVGGPTRRFQKCIALRSR
jgi:hypothetical protein